MACRWQPGMKITALLDALNSALAEPFVLAWSQDSPRFLLVFTVVYAVAVIVAVTDQKNTRPGAEHGSAAWGDVFCLNKFYMDKRGPNLLLTQHFHIGIDGYKHKHNTNILIVGGSGAGKTRTYGVPNVLECACSMVITDPKSEILRKTGNLLKRKGYEVLVFDLINPAASFCYNPFVYVHDDREVLTLIENLIQNTTPSHSKSSDPFWEKSETALLQALMLYLLHEAPPEEQNFPMVMEMIAAAEVHEDDDNYQSPLDILFERLEMREPDSIACKQYRIFKQAAGKTAKSILVSVGVRLAAFNLPSIAKLTMTDELHLQELGERKIALFCCIPDSDKSLNYLVGMIYTQLIQTLYRQADRVHKGRLPVPVHCLMDEYANITEEVAAQINGILHDIQTGESTKPNLQEQLEQTQQEFDRLLEMSLDFDEDIPFLDDRLKKLNNKMKSLKKAIEDSAAQQEKASQPEMLLSAKDLQIQEYDDALTARIIEKITVRSRNEIEIRFIGGYKKTIQLT